MKLTQLQLIRRLEKHIAKQYDGTKSKAAEHWGIFPQHLGHILEGKPFQYATDEMLEDLGKDTGKKIVHHKLTTHWYEEEDDEYARDTNKPT